MSTKVRHGNDHLVTGVYWLTWLTACLALAAGLRVDLDRPGYRNPFPDRSYLTRLALRQLTDDETIQLVGGVLPGASLPAELRRLIVAKADGNPFFIEELLKSLLESGADLVIGSKLIGGARDQRPLTRHAASVIYTKTLQVLLGFPGTDTHGLKAFRRSRLLPIVEACVVDRDVFASELVIRAYRAGLHVREVPTRVAEMRPPSINLLRRVPNVAKNLWKLTWAIRLRG